MSTSKTASYLLAFIVAIFSTGCGGYGTRSTPPPTTAQHFAFVANSLSNSVSTFAVDPQTGQLRAKGTMQTGGTKPRVIAVEPSGRFAYVGNIASNNISVFSVDVNTGRLAMVGSPVSTGNGPGFVVLGPAGNLLYVVNQNDDQITGFSINSNTGALTPLTGGTLSCGGASKAGPPQRYAFYLHVAMNPVNPENPAINPLPGLTPDTLVGTLLLGITTFLKAPF